MHTRNATVATFLTLLACNSPQAPTPVAPAPTAPTVQSATPAPAVEVENGHQRLLDDQGRLLMEGDMLDGQRHGLWTAYHKNGQVQSRTSYATGQREGPTVVFRPNGALYYKGQYANDHPVGESGPWYAPSHTTAPGSRWISASGHPLRIPRSVNRSPTGHQQMMNRPSTGSSRSGAVDPCRT
jgi:hypothetical protein